MRKSHTQCENHANNAYVLAFPLSWLTPYLFVGAVYALICLALSRLGLRLERRWQRAQG